MSEENNELPEGWVTAKVAELADVVEPGFPYGKYNTIGLGFPQLRPMNIDGQGRLCLDEIKYADLTNPPLLQSGDILFNNTNSPVWVGKTTVIPEDGKFTFSNHMTRLRLSPHAGLSTFFAMQLQYLQQSGYFQARCNHHVNQASISSSYLSSNVDLIVPPIAEQDRIVSAIEQQFTRLDAGVAALRRTPAKLKRYRAAVLKAAVEGKLTEVWRFENPDIEPATILLERILKERRTNWEADLRAKGKDLSKVKYVEPAKPDTENLPEGWCWARAEQLCDFITKGTTPSAEKLYNGTGEIPFIKVYNLTNHGLLDFNIKPSFISRQTHSQELARSRVFPGDILMNIVGPPLGKVSIVPDLYPEWNINQAIVFFRPMPGFNQIFLCFTLLIAV